MIAVLCVQNRSKMEEPNFTVGILGEIHDLLDGKEVPVSPDGKGRVRLLENSAKIQKGEG